MYTLRLFHQADLSREIEARRLDEGELAIGRDAAADWPIPDPARTLSRRHCVLSLKDGALSLCDTSANGVYLGAARHRLDLRTPTPVASGDAFQLGEFVIVVEEQRSFAAADDSPFDGPFRHPILDDSQIGAEHLEVRSNWPDALPVTSVLPPSSDGALLEAFCSGAGLDASSFSGHDPAVVMHRLGEVYRQMVLGLGELMQDRRNTKSRYRVERTRVRAEGNNPFKWAAPQRLAADLLRGGGAAFLEGPDAVAAAFVDLKKHQLAMLAGMRAAIAATLDGLSPESVEAAQERQSYVLKAKVNWAEYLKLYEVLRKKAEADPDSPLNRAFAEAYERRLEELDALVKPAKVPA